MVVFRSAYAAVLLAVALLGLSAPPARAASGDIVFARAQDADALDVARVSTTISFQVMTQIYETLLNEDEKGQVVPGLASSYTASPDNKTFTFTIRPNIKCHDGSTFDAAAAKWNIDRIIDPKTGSSNASSYGKITSTSVSGNVLTITQAEPYSPMPMFLTSALALMMCPSTIQGSDVKPVGTGPWKFVEWVRNDRLVLERNPDYANDNPLVGNADAPYQKRLIFRVIPEGPARMAALRTGEATIVEPSLQDAADLAKDRDYKVYTGEGRTGQLAYLGFTAKIPPLNDARVRRAIGYAVDRDAIVNGEVMAATGS